MQNEIIDILNVLIESYNWDLKIVFKILAWTFGKIASGFDMLSILDLNLGEALENMGSTV